MGVLDTTEKKTDAQKRVMINQKIRLNTNLIIEPADKEKKRKRTTDLDKPSYSDSDNDSKSKKFCQIY